jgi:hypothetical protein
MEKVTGRFEFKQSVNIKVGLQEFRYLAVGLLKLRNG